VNRSQGEQHIVVIANGEFQHPERLRQIVESADSIIAADGGANWLVKQGRIPDVLIGDMDSVTPAVLQALEQGHCRLLRHAPDKDETDTELALLEAVSLGAKRITLLGATGGRIDHALANILLLTIPPLRGVDVALFDGRSRLCVARESIVVQGEIGDTVSLIPLAGDAEGIVTEGMKYPLRDETLRFGLARGISNVLLATMGRVTWRRGTLLVVHTPQAYLEER
jgi:thiamine pyrophosphokinase